MPQDMGCRSGIGPQHIERQHHDTATPAGLTPAGVGPAEVPDELEDAYNCAELSVMFCRRTKKAAVI